MTRLTATLVKNLAPVPGRRVEVRDGQVPGLYFRVTEHGKRSWSVRYRGPDGGHRRLTLGSYPAVSLSQARDRTLKVLAAVADGKDPAIEKQAEKRRLRQWRANEPVTLGELWPLFSAATGPNKRKGTRDQQAGLWSRHLHRQAGAWRLENISRKGVRDLVRNIAAATPTTANRAQSLLSTMLNWAVDEEYLHRNPIAGMGKLYRETSRDRVLSEAELRTLLAALESAPIDPDVEVSPQACLALKFVLLTGARGGDVVAIHSREIDHATCNWVIPASRFKGKVEHVIPISHAAMGVLEAAFCRDTFQWDGFAFPNSRNPTAPMLRHSLTRAMSRIVEHADLDRVTPHDLRRTMATYLASRFGASQDEIAKVLGHRLSGPAVTAVYNRHTYDDQKRRALESWSKYLDQFRKHGSRNHLGGTRSSTTGSPHLLPALAAPLAAKVR